MHNFIGNAVNGTLHSWALSGQWDNLLLVYGLVFLYIGYKFLGSLVETMEDLGKFAESEDAIENAMINIFEWVMMVLPLSTVFAIAWYHYYG